MKRGGPLKRHTWLQRTRQQHHAARATSTWPDVHASDAGVPQDAKTAAMDRDSLHERPVCALAGWRIAGIACSRILDAHHRMLIGMGGSSSLARDWLPRLVTLCRAHHEWAHTHRKEAEQAGIIVRRGDGDVTKLTTAAVRYALSVTGWACLTADGRAVDCPPPADVPEGFAA